MQDNNLTADQTERIRLGDVAKQGLESEFWMQIIKPIIDSMITGITDIRNLKAADIMSDVKAKSEIMGRKIGAEYISEIETLIRGHIDDADTTVRVLERQNNKKQLYKTV